MQYNNMDDALFQYEGRIIKKDGVSYLGHTNSYLRFWVKGQSVRAKISSNITEPINMAGLYVFIDGEKKEVKRIVLDKENDWYDMCMLPDDLPHLVTIVKVTEAAMSHAGFETIDIINGEILDMDFPNRPELKLEFIGDSITCGFGVLGEPYSEYTLRNEDGLLSYAQVAADILNARARFVSASGYGAYIEYTGNLEGNVPKLYPYVNWFVDNTELYDYSEYIPDVVIINLGTNDSCYIDKDDVQKGFVDAYSDFIRLIRNAYPKAAILCICGTLCQTMFDFIDKAVDVVRCEGIEGIYVRRLPYHDIETDGMASEHPSPATHKKDGERVAGFIKEILAK